MPDEGISITLYPEDILNTECPRSLYGERTPIATRRATESSGHDFSGADTGELVGVEESSEWSEQDIRDLTAFSLNYASTLYPEEVDYV